MRPVRVLTRKCALEGCEHTFNYAANTRRVLHDVQQLVAERRHVVLADE